MYMFPCCRCLTENTSWVSTKRKKNHEMLSQTAIRVVGVLTKLKNGGVGGVVGFTWWWDLRTAKFVSAHINKATHTYVSTSHNDAVQQRWRWRRRQHAGPPTMTPWCPVNFGLQGFFHFSLTHATHQLTHPTGHPRRDQTINATRALPHRDPLPSQCPANQCLQGFFHFSLTHATSQLTMPTGHPRRDQTTKQYARRLTTTTSPHNALQTAVCRAFFILTNSRDQSTNTPHRTSTTRLND